MPRHVKISKWAKRFHGRQLCIVSGPTFIRVFFQKEENVHCLCASLRKRIHKKRDHFSRMELRLVYIGSLLVKNDKENLFPEILIRLAMFLDIIVGSLRSQKDFFLKLVGMLIVEVVLNGAAAKIFYPRNCAMKSVFFAFGSDFGEKLNCLCERVNVPSVSRLYLHCFHVTGKS